MGEDVAAGLYRLAGLAAYALVVAALVISVRCFRGPLLRRGLGEAFGFVGLFAASTVLLHLPFSGRPVRMRGPGGWVGERLAEACAVYLGGAGAALSAATLLCVSLLLLTEVRVAEVMAVLAWTGRHAARAVLVVARSAWRIAIAMFPEKEEAQAKPRELTVEDGDIVAAVAVVDSADPAPLATSLDVDSEAISVGRPPPGLPLALDLCAEGSTGPDEEACLSPAEEERRAVADLIAEVAATECAAEPAAPEAPPRVEMPTRLAAGRDRHAPIIVEPAFHARPRKHEDEDGPRYIQLSEGAFTLPGLDLLAYQAPQAAAADEQALRDMAQRLEQAMANYGVRGKVTEIHMGPVVTMFEFAPEPGTRTGKIVQLENDLAMALEAQAVRIVAPIPGKAVVGVEVPNRQRETVFLREILKDDCFAGASSKLQVALGKDIKGAPVSVNLAKMPHLLVAGTTGSGKSVTVNGMIASILYSATPEEVRFIMVDPKMLELSVYEGIPQLLLPVMTDPKKAALALRWAVEEMERRYETLAKLGVRDIAAYNAKLDADRARREARGAVAEALAETPSKRARRVKVLITGPDGVEREVAADPETEGPLAGEESFAHAAQDRGGPADADEAQPRRLPYIVIVIDEFADLMMVAPKDIETSVTRLAQKARAAGLHLILATQRPSVDVITGVIKANFPSRIALQVASKVDSRTILDQPGAETLLGNGDMLFSDRGTKLRRIHGAFLASDEVQRVAEFLRKQAKPVYDMDILRPRDDDADDDGAPVDNVQDELYDRALAIVCETGQATVSFIQRRLQIGYNRAARMIERMEREGIVGPANGLKPREVLAPRGDYLTAVS